MSLTPLTTLTPLTPQCFLYRQFLFFFHFQPDGERLGHNHSEEAEDDAGYVGCRAVISHVARKAERLSGKIRVVTAVGRGYDSSRNEAPADHAQQRDVLPREDGVSVDVAHEEDEGHEGGHPRQAVKQRVGHLEHHGAKAVAFLHGDNQLRRPHLITLVRTLVSHGHGVLPCHFNRQQRYVAAVGRAGFGHGAALRAVLHACGKACHKCVRHGKQVAHNHHEDKNTKQVESLFHNSFSLSALHVRRHAMPAADIPHIYL